MDKMDGNGLNLLKLNIERLEELFPQCISEGKIDFNALRVILGDNLDNEQEKYGLSWSGKRKAITESLTPSTSTLVPQKEKSVNWDSTKNIYIEGDNLEVLKTIAKTYHSAIDMIYIDPPYNTGNDFVYNDDFAESNESFLENSAQALKSNPETSGRYHTNWLNMMYPRLKLAYELLSNEGVVFISIDDNEVANLRKIADEIFGQGNFEGEITYVRKTSGKQDSSNFAKSTEYILVYSKNSCWECKKIVAGDNVIDRYNKTDELGKKYRVTDLRKTGNADRRVDRPLMFYPFYYNKETKQLEVRREHDEKLINDGYIEILPIKPDGSEGRWRWGFESSKENIAFLEANEMAKYKGKYTIYEIDYLDKNGDIRTVKEHTFWDRKEFNSDNAILELKNLGFSNQIFPFPKSSALLKHIVYLSNKPDGTCLDFFSGSATFAHAVMQLNAEDGGRRKFILVQLPEICDDKSEAKINGFNTICEIGEERIRRSAKAIYDSLKAKKEEAGLLENEYVDPDSLDLGFKVFSLTSTNIIPWDGSRQYDESNLLELNDVFKEGRTKLDVAYEVMLKYGVFDKQLEEKKINGKDVFCVDNDSLVIFLEDEINMDDVKEIIKLNPTTVVFKESGFADDNVKMNAEYTLRHYLGEDQIKVLCI